MREIKALISAGIAAASYVMLPDILDQEETVCFLLIVALSLYVIMTVIESEIKELHERREALRIRKSRNGSMSKFNLPKRKIIIFPEERYETRRNA